MRPAADPPPFSEQPKRNIFSRLDVHLHGVTSWSHVRPLPYSQLSYEALGCWLLCSAAAEIIPLRSTLLPVTWVVFGLTGPTIFRDSSSECYGTSAYIAYIVHQQTVPLSHTDLATQFIMR